MSEVINLWHGAMTDAGFRVVAKIDGALACLRVSAAEDMSDPAYLSAPQNPKLGVVRFEAAGLQASTRYYYQVEVDGVADSAKRGHTRTFPALGQPASFTFAASSCSGHYNGGLTGGTTWWPPGKVSAVSNAAVFETIRQRDVDLFIHMGDLHYRDIAQNDPDLYRQGYDDVLSAPNQAALYRDTPLAYVWDDHDFGPNDSNKTSPGRPAAVQAFRERVPSYALPDPEGVWHTWAIGRVRFIMTDGRSYADPANTSESPAKTLLGQKQKQWLKETLLSATEPLICWASPVPWHINTTYADERQEIADFLVDNGIASRMFLISGDWHGLGFDDGTNNKWGGFPVYQCSSLDSAPSTEDQKRFSHGRNRARGQYGVFTIEDDGTTITVIAQGFIGNQLLLHHSFQVQPPAAARWSPILGSERGIDSPDLGRKAMYQGRFEPILQRYASIPG